MLALSRKYSSKGAVMLRKDEALWKHALMENTVSWRSHVRCYCYQAA